MKELGQLLGVPYSLLSDPRPASELGAPMADANCRRLVQEFYYQFGIPLPAKSCLSEAAFERLGVLVWDRGSEITGNYHQIAHFGDIVFAESLRQTSDSQYSPEQKLHMGIWLGPANEPAVAAFAGIWEGSSGDLLIFHSTNRGRSAGIPPERIGTSTVWTLPEFASVYQVRRLRRLPEFTISLEGNADI